MDIYRKRDCAAVTPSHPDGGSRERAGRGVPLARAAHPRPHRFQSCPKVQEDPETCLHAHLLEVPPTGPNALVGESKGCAPLLPCSRWDWLSCLQSQANGEMC